jgi:hypothetical protein
VEAALKICRHRRLDEPKAVINLIRDIYYDLEPAKQCVP